MFYYSLTAYKSGPGINLVLLLACKPTRVAINVTAVSAGKYVINVIRHTLQYYCYCMRMLSPLINWGLYGSRVWFTAILIWQTARWALCELKRSLRQCLDGHHGASKAVSNPLLLLLRGVIVLRRHRKLYMTDKLATNILALWDIIKKNKKQLIQLPIMQRVTCESRRKRSLEVE